MADFFDREAVSSEGSEDEEVREEIRKHRKLKKKHQKKSQIGSDDEDSDEEDEEDDEAKIAEEMQDLINDDVEEEEEDEDDDDDGRSHGHKRSYDDDELEEDLEDDDYDLLEENLGHKIDRKKKKFRRVRRLEDDDEDDDENNGQTSALEAREAIANELFDDDLDQTYNDGQTVDNQKSSQMINDRFGVIDSEQSESDENDDFIVDDNDQPIVNKQRSKNRSYDYSDKALQQAQDIFGVDFDFDILDENNDLIDDENEMEDIEEDYDDEYDDEGMADERSKVKVRKKRQKMTKKSIFELYEPAELERSHLTEADNIIRNTDIPERFQTRSYPVTACDSNERREEAEWIYRNLYEIPTVTKQDKNLTIRQPLAGLKPRSTINIISQILKFIRNEQWEVPFIAYYRKEYYAPDLSIKDLWLIFYWDEKWCRLNDRKKNLIKLLENMKEYQLSLLIGSNTDSSNTESADADNNKLMNDFRRVTDKDIQRANSIQSFEEFNDCYIHFQLYYCNELTAMKKYMLEQKRQLRQQKRLQKQKKLNEATAEGEGATEDPEAANEGEEEVNDDEEEDINDEQEEMMLSERMNFMRLSMKKDTYLYCKESGLGRMARRFGLTPEQFGEHLSESYHKHDIEQYPIEPLEAAAEFVSKRFDTPEKVLQASTFMVGKQLSCDPLVRRTVRQMFYERATVTVRPTRKGRKEIDESHPCYSFKYLRNKPISSFIGEQFIQLNQAKQDGLLEMVITLDNDDLNNNNNNNNNDNQIRFNETMENKQFQLYLNEIKHLYQRDEFSKNVQEWNDQRAKALDIALNRFLYPFLVKEMITKILTETHQIIIQQCADKLASLIAIGPYMPEFVKERNNNIDDDEDNIDDEFDTRNGIRIMGFAHMPSNEEASYCALIDGDGEITDYIKLEHYMLKRLEGAHALTEKERYLRDKDYEKLKNFILSKKPHAIALGADTIVTKDIMEELQQLLRNLHEDERHFPLIPVEYVDSELSIVFMNSKRANADYHNYPLKLRQAISLARRLQDPILEFAQLCTADEEILCLKLHPLQEYVSRDELLIALNAEFVNRVNEIGVDINRCIVHPYTSSLVQFIGGLGPRKGAHLLRTLKKQATPLLETRTQLIQNCGIGKSVFINCAGFIKIDTNSFADSGTDTYIEVLDSTRIHPEAHEWARKMAVDALDYDEDNDHNPAQALEEIIENPEKLRDLDLDEFAKELLRQGYGLKKQTLYDIRNELTDRYQDKRKPYRSPNDEEIFEMLTGENLSTFHVGKLVQVRVTGVIRRKPKTDQVDQAQPIRMETGLWKCPFCLRDDFNELGEIWSHFDTNQCPGQAFGVRCKLDNGLTGIIPLKFLSDKDVTDPLTRVKIGMTVNCRILKIQIEKFTLELTCRTSDLVDQNNRFKPLKDTYYDYQTESIIEQFELEKSKRKSMQKQRTYMKRLILHPSFHNIDFKKSEQILANSPQGETVIRPSSKGTDHLTLSWKVHDGIHQNISIREEGKANPFSLGQQLFIDNEQFEDLDEIIARYVQPMAGFARDMINFKYFRDLMGDRLAAEKVLNDEKQKAPSRIPYIVSASKEFPGKFLLSYQPNQKAFHEFITIIPEGFKYRNIIFKSINALFKWFKEHYKDRSTFTMSMTNPVGGVIGAVPQTTPLMNASPFTGQQRTPQSSTTSPYVGGTQNSNKFIPTPNINPQALQRAAATMPNHLFNTLSQVTGQASSNFNGNHATAQSSNAAYSSNNNFHNVRPTNLYQSAAAAAGSYNRQTLMPPPPPPAPPIPSSLSSTTNVQNNSRPNSRGGGGSSGGNQWSDLLKQSNTDWHSHRRSTHHSSSTSTSASSSNIMIPLINNNNSKHQRTPGYSTPGASSQMSISPMQEDMLMPNATPNIVKAIGDQTPLVDEWN